MMHLRFTTWWTAAAAVLALAVETQAAAQGQAGSPYVVARRTSGGDESPTGTYRSFMVALPIVSLDRGTTARLELNLYGKASLALEGNLERRGQDLSKHEIGQSNESMMTQGKGLALYLNRYSRPYTLSGFYYGLGLGYREEDADWHERTDSRGASLADATYANHEAVLKGPTGHLRAGYRYVGSDYPLLIGAYLGARHFQATVSDGPAGSSPPPGGVPVTAMTDAEKDHLKRRFETAPELGIEVGFVF